MQDSPILILGAGINGAALARELLLNGVPVTLVDTADIASGTTAYSSRLIHGGLRYLEFGELDLVRESLAERTRLLRLAPHLVQPLQLFIPTSNRFGGTIAAARSFFGWGSGGAKSASRGMMAIRIGLRMYDAYAQDRTLPRHRSYRIGDFGVPEVDSNRYRWLLSYYDAQVRYPERFTLALVEDAAQIAAERGVEFRLLTYHEARLEGKTAVVQRVADHAEAIRFQPAAIVNATGAWVDQTLARLAAPSQRLMGGTKGSHLLTSNENLRNRLRGRAIYAEARDGRPVFVLPFGEQTLVGTTDLRYEGDPGDAVASADELDYLLECVNHVFAGLRLTRADVEMHYSGVRPLPRTEGGTTAGITRRHWMHEHTGTALPLYSIIGGKLTTCRSLAESSAATLLGKLNRPVERNSQERCLPGGAGHPLPDELPAVLQRIAERFELRADQVQAIWALRGTSTEAVLASCLNDAADRVAVTGSLFPRGFVQWVIEHEFVSRLDDLVERRLMLLYSPGLSRECLTELAALLVAAGRLDEGNAEAAVARTVERLTRHFGKTAR